MSSLPTRTQTQIYRAGNGVDDSTGTTGRRRSQRVMLRVPILVKTRIGKGTPSGAEGVTLVVNAHGGLLESTLPVADNEEIILAVPYTGKEVGCRVVRSEVTSSGLVRFAFEFGERTCKFWPISFPPEDWEEVGSCS
jgi:hypothetical protein